MDYEFVKATCPFCGCGYQMFLEVTECCWEEALGEIVCNLSPIGKNALDGCDRRAVTPSSGADPSLGTVCYSG